MQQFHQLTTAKKKDRLVLSCCMFDSYLRLNDYYLVCSY